MGAIGIFDSGIGGLSIWQDTIPFLANESIIYLADSKNVPYGEKSSEEITQLALKLTHFLSQKKVKLIIVACNTITVSSLDHLRSEFPHMPIIGTVPPIKTTIQFTKKKKIGVFSTLRTAKSQYQKNLLQKVGSDYEIINLGSNKIAPLIEKGEIETMEFNKLLQFELQPFIQAGIDTLALGCTHYPFIKDQIQQILGPKIQIIDSTSAIARHTYQILKNKNLLSVQGKPSYQFFTTGESEQFKNTAKKLLKKGFSEKIEIVEEIGIE